MKFRCERDVLADALATAGRAVSSRNTGLPALSGLHFKTNDDQLKLVGTDSATIAREATALLDDRNLYAQRARAVFPYGDGTASTQISDILAKEFG